MQIPANKGDIKRLSSALGLEGKPVLLPVEPVEHALPSECYPNVDTQTMLHRPQAQMLLALVHRETSGR